MKNKILTFPIISGAGETSPINRFQADMENLLNTADNILPEDLLDDSGVVGAAAENWGRYKKIVRGIFAADDAGWGLLLIKYQQGPSIVKDSASVTIMLQKDRPFTNEAKVAFAMAALLADQITTTTGDGNAQIRFTVCNIHTTDNDAWT